MAAAVCARTLKPTGTTTGKRLFLPRPRLSLSLSLYLSLSLSLSYTHTNARTLARTRAHTHVERGRGERERERGRGRGTQKVQGCGERRRRIRPPGPSQRRGPIHQGDALVKKWARLHPDAGRRAPPLLWSRFKMRFSVPWLWPRKKSPTGDMTAGPMGDVTAGVHLQRAGPMSLAGCRSSSALL
jgi:hypothetical protein